MVSQVGSRTIPFCNSLLLAGTRGHGLCICWGHCDSASPTGKPSPWDIPGFQHQTCLFGLVGENDDSEELLLSRRPLGETTPALSA